MFLREFGTLCVSCVPDLTSRNERDDRSSGIVRTILPIGRQRRELVEQKDLTPWLQSLPLRQEQSPHRQWSPFARLSPLPAAFPV
jgi:hypothetical protein